MVGWGWWWKSLKVVVAPPLWQWSLFLRKLLQSAADAITFHSFSWHSLSHFLLISPYTSPFTLTVSLFLSLLKFWFFYLSVLHEFVLLSAPIPLNTSSHQKNVITRKSNFDIVRSLPVQMSKWAIIFFSLFAIPNNSSLCPLVKINQNSRHRYFLIYLWRVHYMRITFYSLSSQREYYFCPPPKISFLIQSFFKHVRLGIKVRDEIPLKLSEFTLRTSATSAVGTLTFFCSASNYL